jgi:nickel/cobalt transporter (NicO) family protein
VSPVARSREAARRARGLPGAPGRPLAGRPRGRRPGWRVRAGLLALLAAGLLAAGAGPAAAHPLGNFTVNAYSGLRVGPDRLVVDYVVDLAEIPAFQARKTLDADRDGRVAAAEATSWRDRECPRLAAGLRATVDGRPVPLAVTGSALAFPEGVGGLATLRLECALAGPLPPGPSSGRSLTYTDGNQEGRVGWREITAVGDRATLDAADVPGGSASARLSRYPEDQLASPLDQRAATLRFHLGGPPAPQATGPALSPAGPAASAADPAPSAAGPAGENPASRCEAPRRGSVADRELGCSALSTPPTPPAVRGGVDRATAAFTALVGERSRAPGFVGVALLLAMVLGAAHALAPGHGKTVMAAYLVGLRGTLRQAATIGATVTLTHTAGVLALGLVLSTTGAVASERVYPWLGLGSGLLLAAVGLGLLVRARPGHHSHPHPHDHTGHHHHHGERPLGRRGLVALGLAGGLVPSPSAVVVLLGGIALGRAWLGVALVLAYGVGMAATLTGVGLLLAHLRTRMDRRLHLPAGSLLARLGRLLPAVTASVIVLVGLGLAVQGAAQL